MTHSAPPPAFRLSWAKPNQTHCFSDFSLFRLDVQSVLQFDALLLLHQGYLAMDLRSGHRPLPSPPLADCRSEQVSHIG
jgi:hypothetical protein